MRPGRAGVLIIIKRDICYEGAESKQRTESGEARCKSRDKSRAMFSPWLPKAKARVPDLFELVVQRIFGRIGRI